MILALTAAAKEYMVEQLVIAEKNYVLLEVKGGGCSGFKYDWSYVEDDSKGTVIDNTLVVDAMAEMFLFGCTVDYVRELGGNYLIVKNPQAKAQCGCGESFGI
jgi:iron-sulfur cluster insertion protein|tara:strand:- start:569 stop:877 length:309 start_codon:yes stop_codon:yes gene_type:complete